MSEINETPNSYTTNLLEQIMVSDCFSKTNVPEIKRSTFDLYVKNIIKLLDIQKTPYLSIGVNDLEKYELLGDSNHLNDVSQLISNFIDLQDKLSKKIVVKNADDTTEIKPVFEDITILNYLSALKHLSKYSIFPNKYDLEQFNSIFIPYLNKIKENLKKEKLKNTNTEDWIKKEEIDKVEKLLKKEYKENNTDPNILQKLILIILYKGKVVMPLKNEYADMLIHNNFDEKGNYLYIDEEDYTEKYFVFNDYDTQKKYVKQKIKIPKRSILNKLLTELYTIREKEGQKHLLQCVGLKTPKQMNKNTLTKYLQKIFMDKINKKVSPSMLNNIHLINKK